jgi:hypothetical protein
MSSSIVGDDAIWVLRTESLYQGLAKGFGLVIGPNKLIGGKKYTEGHFIAYLPQLDDAGRMQALRVAGEIAKSRGFEIMKNQLISVETKEPGKFKPGHIIFKTIQGEYKVNATGTFGSSLTGAASIYELVLKLMNDFAPGKIRRADN